MLLYIYAKELEGYRATKQTTQKLQNNYTKEILALLRNFQDPQQIFQPGDLAKGWRTPREFDSGGQWDLITERPQAWGNRLLAGTKKTLCAPGARRKEQRPHKRLIRLACECPGVSSRDSGQATGREHNPIHQQKIGVKIY